VSGLSRPAGPFLLQLQEEEYVGVLSHAFRILGATPLPLLSSSHEDEACTRTEADLLPPFGGAGIEPLGWAGPSARKAISRFLPPPSAAVTIELLSGPGLMFPPFPPYNPMCVCAVPYARSVSVPASLIIYMHGYERAE